MRALLINSRPDAETNPGGDTVQFEKTRRALEKLGVRVEAGRPDRLHALPECDIAHVFNIQTPESAWSVVEALAAKRVPIALSSIYWDMYPHWFELAASERFRWRLLTRIAGRKAIGRLYVKWQHSKSASSPAWQTQRRLLEKADAVLPNSRMEGRLLETTFRLGGGFRRKVHVVPNGIDAELYEPAPRASDQFLNRYGVRDFVLEVGTIYPVKNQLALIEALFDLPVPLVFAGPVRAVESGYADACRSLGARRGNVLFLDPVPHDQLPGIYALAAVHALPSWRETPGLVSLEAAASGCRVVTTSIGSAREYFGDSAWYCHPADRASIRKAVEGALKAPEVPGLRAGVLDRYTWRRAGEATLGAYEAVLKTACNAAT